jgi:hypothetical protein
MKMFLLGVMVAYTPSLLVLAVMLWQAPELEDKPSQRADYHPGQKSRP